MTVFQKLLKQPSANWFLLASFFLIWIVYFSILGLLGYESQYGSMLPAIVLQLLFILLAGMFAAALPARAVPSPNSIGVRHLKILIFVGIALSVVGIACLLTDKMLLGINYMKDICSARYQMVNLAQGRTGVRSFYSFFGNLLSTSFFAPMVVVLTQNVTRKLFYTTAVCAFSCLLIFSFLAASRTAIMLFGAFSLAAICVRLWGGRGLPKLIGKDIFFVAGMTFIAALFVGQVFACRAHNSHLTTTQYEAKFANFLGAAEGTGDIEATGVKESAQTKIRGVIGVTALYFVHSAYIFSGIIELEERPGHALFIYAEKLLKKVGFIKNEDDEPTWYFAGKFPSLPGGLYYDYGVAGLVIGASILGLLAGLAGRLWMKSPGNIVLIGITTSLYVIMFLSPLMFAGDVMTFPFICFAFITIPVITSVIAKICKPFLAKEKPEIKLPL